MFTVLPTPFLVIWTIALVAFAVAVVLAAFHWGRDHRVGDLAKITLVASGLTVLWVYPGLVAIAGVALIALARRLRQH